MPSIPTPFKHLVAAVAVGACVLTATAVAADRASDALAAFESQGYVAIYDLKLRHGHWSAEGSTQEGARVQLLLDGQGRVVEVGNPATHEHIAGAEQVIGHLESLGYQRVRDVELDDGFWEAEARNAAGQEVDLVLHPVTLEVLAEVVDGHGDGAPGAGSDMLPASEVRTALERAGYTRIHDLEFDDGYWEADAINGAGQRVELRIDPRTGAVVREKLDD